MHRLLPPLLNRIALRLAHKVRFLWWRVARRDLHGCNVLVGNPAGEVLLVRHSYQSPDRWMLPGGGMRRNEPAEAAAMREVREETGCHIVNCVAFDIDIEPLAGCRNHVHLVAATSSDQPKADGREVVEARFFALDALPETISANAEARIARWRDWQRGKASRTD